MFINNKKDSNKQVKDTESDLEDDPKIKITLYHNSFFQDAFVIRVDKFKC